MSLIHKKFLILAFMSASGLLTSFSAIAQDSEWSSVTGTETLKMLLIFEFINGDAFGIDYDDYH